MRCFTRFSSIAMALTLFAGPADALQQSPAPQTSVATGAVDTSGADAFWGLVDSLRGGHALTDADWDTFLAVKGNARLVTTSYSPDMLADLRSSILAVFSPDQSHVESATDLRFYSNFEYVSENEDRIRNLSTRFSSPQNIAAAYDLSYDLLPDCFRQDRIEASDVAIYLHSLNDGATALSKPDEIYFSLAIVDFDGLNTPNATFGHELHHLLRPQREYQNVTLNDAPVLEILERLLNEGSADLIDGPKKTKIEGYSGWNRWIRSDAHQAIVDIDSLISGPPLVGDESTTAVSRVIRGSGGHIPGFVMAETIENAGLKSELIASIDDPFAFMILYQRAAVALELEAFSDSTMRRILEMKTRYSDWRQVGRYDMQCQKTLE